MKRIASMLVMASVGLSVFAQTDTVTVAALEQAPEQASESSMVSILNQEPDSFIVPRKSVYIPITQYWREHNIFQHLDVALSLGTTGIGFEVGSPIGEYVTLRAGYEFMPHFKKTMKFDMTIKGEPVRRYDENGFRQETTFDKLKEFLYQMTGYDVEDHADMIGKPTINNAKLLVDVYPFKRNKHWRVTAGVFWGPSQFATADNSAATMISLLSVGMYNRMYERAINGEPLFDLSEFSNIPGVFDIPDELTDKFKNFGRLGFSVGYYTHDVYGTYAKAGTHYEMQDGKQVEVKHQAGETYLKHAKGDRYIVEPGDDGMVHVKAKSNPFKPYLGFGYEGRLLKSRDDWKVSFDCGAMFWGGTPDLYVHDGMNLVSDVEHVNGQVGNYVKLFKAFKVYPVLGIHLIKTIF